MLQAMKHVEPQMKEALKSFPKAVRYFPQSPALEWCCADLDLTALCCRLLEVDITEGALNQK